MARKAKPKTNLLIIFLLKKISPSPRGRFLCLFASVYLAFPQSFLHLPSSPFSPPLFSFFCFQLSPTGWRNEVKDPDTRKWVDDTKAFRQRRRLLHGATSPPASPTRGQVGGLSGGRGSPAGFTDQQETESAVSRSGDSMRSNDLQPSAPVAGRAQFVGLDLQQTADLKAAWNKILG